MKGLLEILGKIPEPVRKQVRRMAWVLFVFILAIQAVSFARTGEFVLFDLKKLFGL